MTDTRRQDVVYFDNNATTPMDPEVLEVMMPYLTKHYGNASSMHSFGGHLRHKIDEARQQVADLLNCHPEEIIFTSGGTESDITAVVGALDVDANKRHIITSRVEHPAIRTTCRIWQKKGCRLTELPVNEEGRLDPDHLLQAIADETAIVTIMYANNETGVIFPMARLAAIAKSRGVTIHTDAVQAVGKIPLDLQKVTVDMLSLSGHKLHGPKGIGALFVRKGTRFKPYMTGGHQEHGRRAGTENVAAIVGLGKACELSKKYLHDEQTRVAQLRDKLENGILAACDNTRVNGTRDSRLPNTTNISFELIEGEAILMLMDHLNIAASSGSACTSGSLEPSHVLRAMGVPFTAVHGSIRFSLSRNTTAEEIDYVINNLPPKIQWLRSMSPFKNIEDAQKGAPVEKHEPLL